MSDKRKRSDNFNSLHLISTNYSNYLPDSKFGTDVNCLKLVRAGVCLSGHNDSAVLYDFYNGKKLKDFPHQQSVTQVAYGTLKSLIFTSSRDKIIRIWNEIDCEPQHVIEAHRLPITGLDISPDNNLLCTGSRDNSIKIWDVQTGKQLLTRAISRNLVTHLRWFPNSHLLLQVSEDKTIRIWDTRNLEVSSTFPEKRHIQTHCDINPFNNNYVLSSSSGNNGDGCEITLWDIRQLKILSEYRGHEEKVNASIFFTPLQSCSDSSSARIASISADLTIRVWDQISRECLTWISVTGTTMLNDIEDFRDESLGVATTQNGIQRFLRGTTHDGKYVLRPVSVF